MKIYLNGLHHKSYGKILKDIGIDYVCMDFSYIYFRTPRISIEELCEPFKEVILIPGKPYADYYILDYVEFLNRYHEYFTYAVEAYRSDRLMLYQDCKVDIIPYWTSGEELEYYRVGITKEHTQIPFSHTTLLNLSKVAKIHGIGYTVPFMDSMNTSIWMAGKSGWTSFFSKNNRLEILDGRKVFHRTAIARKLIDEGWSLDLLKVKKNDWKEIAKLNCIAWKKYQNYLEVQGC